MVLGEAQTAGENRGQHESHQIMVRCREGEVCGQLWIMTRIGPADKASAQSATEHANNVALNLLSPLPLRRP